MPEPTQLARVDADVHADAGAAAPLMGRSLTKQVTHWARIGREVEAAMIQATHRRRIAATVDGDATLYDTLSADEQAQVRAIWSQRIDATAANLDLAEEKQQAGLPYATVDEAGNPVVVHPDGTTTSP